MSMIPVREALARLLPSRLVNVENNRGYFVADKPTPNSLIELRYQGKVISTDTKLGRPKEGGKVNRFSISEEGDLAIESDLPRNQYMQAREKILKKTMDCSQILKYIYGSIVF